MEQLGDVWVGQHLLQIGRGVIAGGELHRMAHAIARRQLGQAEPVAERVEPQRFGIDRHHRTQIEPVRQVVLMQLDLHDGSIAQEALNS